MHASLPHSFPTNPLVVTDDYTQLKRKSLQAKTEPEKTCLEAPENSLILSRVCRVILVSPLYGLDGLAKAITGASNSIVKLSGRVNRYFNNRCRAVAETSHGSLHQKRFSKKVASASSPKRLRYARRMLKRPPARNWEDTFKSIQIIMLRGEQYLWNLALGEVKQSIDDPTDLYDHYALSGYQVLPDHFYDALNATRANCMVFGRDGVGVLPCESPEQIMKSKVRFSILQLIYGSFF